MKVILLVIGDSNNKHFIAAQADYEKRLSHYLNFEMKVIPELRDTKNLSEDQQKTREGELILKNIKSGDYVVLLDEHGKEFRSVEFSVWIQQIMNRGVQRLVFVVGGPYGFSSSVYEVCSKKISLSKLTFSHQMIRLIFVEQLYRAMTILRNEPYHHE